MSKVSVTGDKVSVTVDLEQVLANSSSYDVIDYYGAYGLLTMIDPSDLLDFIKSEGYVRKIIEDNIETARDVMLESAKENFKTEMKEITNV